MPVIESDIIDETVPVLVQRGRSFADARRTAGGEFDGARINRSRLRDAINVDSSRIARALAHGAKMIPSVKRNGCRTCNKLTDKTCSFFGPEKPNRTITFNLKAVLKRCVIIICNNNGF
jgi:hypothetical protein